MSKPRTRPIAVADRLVLVALVLVALVVCLCAPAAAHVVPMTDCDRIRASEHVVVATVESSRVRWNEQRTLIVTDYVLAVEDRLKGEAPARVRITIPGGTLDGETHETCLTTRLAPGGRYLLFLGDLDRPALTPVTGAHQGIFHETPEKDPRGVDFTRRVETVRNLVARVEEMAADAEEPEAVPAPALRLPAKVYDPAGPRPQGEPVPPLGSPLPQPTAEKYFPLPYKIDLPVTFNPFTADTALAPRDQELMSRWNFYAGGLFQVYSSPSPTWAFGNDVFDLAGFPDDGQMAAQFGRGWPTGVLGITFFRLGDDAQALEADIALNPAYGWTLDPRLATTPGNGTYSFDHVMLHELGHGWGLAHPFQEADIDYDSIMNYVPQELMLARLTADDVAAVRDLFGGTSLRDVAIAAHSTEEAFLVGPIYRAVRPSPTTLRSGANLTLTNRVRLENLGTDNVVRPTLEVYLTPQRMSLAGAVLVKKILLQTTLEPLDTLYLTLAPIKVPKKVRPGTYYVAFRLPDSRDADPANNVVWTIHTAPLRVTR
jgi:hypothetical protein